MHSALVICQAEAALPEKPDYSDAQTHRVDVCHEQEARGFLCGRTYSVIVTVGASFDRSCMNGMPYWLRRYWVHREAMPTAAEIDDLSQANHLRQLRDTDNSLPLVSIFTATHNAARFIDETYETVRAQTWSNWEWVVVDDGSTDGTVFKLHNYRDPRVRVFPMNPVNRIGFLKRAACAFARGDYLVELDHDDWLTEDAVTSLLGTFRAHPEAVMAYSDFSEYYPETGTCNRYKSPDWHYRTEVWRGRAIDVASAPDVNGACSAGRVIEHMPLCPNHVRAFTRRGYDLAGGYRDLVWADDYDLMVRLYKVGRIVHVPKLLYVQRMHERNTWTRYAARLYESFPVLKEHYKP